MRCPKCHYLSFEPEPRCRNCGFGLSLDEIDPAKASGDVSDPLGELSLRPTTAASGADVSARAVMEVPPASPVRTVASAAADRLLAETPPGPRTPAGRAPAAATSELPLFVKGLETESDRAQIPASRTPVSPLDPAPAAEPARMTDVAAETPLIKLPAEPRAPLGVRRKVSDGSAPRPARHTHGSHSRKLGPLDRDLLEDLQRIEKLEQVDVALDRTASHEAPPDGRAGAGKRAAAAALDAVLMGGLATAVLAITLRWCDIPFSRATVLPMAPTAAFLLLVGAGYLLMFTAAGGQTLGKMAFGLRVVGDDADGALTMKQAVYRSVLAVPSVLAFGAGFLPALVGDERALHDRLAHTRVVRA
jgi:uncharacterized RDD family membrane protein YckC